MSGDTERVIGALQEFKESAKADLAKLDGKVDELAKKVDEISRWRIRIGGGVAVVAIMIEMGFHLLK